MPRKEIISGKDDNIFEGITSISALINAKNTNNNDRKIIKILIDKSKINAKWHQIAFLKSAALKYDFIIEYVEFYVIDELATSTSHGGFLALCSDRHYIDVKSLTPSEQGFYVYLDGIEDPYNFGYTLRSLYAAGADGIILPERNWLSSAGIVARSSAGASELFNIYISNSFDEIYDCFHASKYRVVAAGIRDSVSLFEADLQKPILLVVGGEKRGISSAVLNKCDITVRIDYGRDFRGSLSASSAATVLGFEVMRQNKIK